MSNAPYCNVKGVVVEGTPSLPALQPIPVATDLPSALKAIQAIKNNFNTLYKFTSNVINTGNFVEVRNLRTTEIVRVFNPQDSAQWVDVQQITGLTFRDPVTGRTLTWRQ
jgi:hypothetical protein